MRNLAIRVAKIPIVIVDGLMMVIADGLMMAVANRLAAAEVNHLAAEVAETLAAAKLYKIMPTMLRAKLARRSKASRMCKT